MRMRVVAPIAAAALLGVAGASHAVIVGGGGARATDCLVVFDADANYPPTAPKQVRCVDGDPSCDADGTVNGVCSLRVRVCANSTADPSCTLTGVAQLDVDHSFDSGNDPKFDPDFLALRQRIAMDFTLPETTADLCTGTVTFTVPIKGPFAHNACGPGRKTLRLHSVSTGATGAKTDADRLRFSCVPAPGNGCDPQTLYGGTFDRIQHQIFNQSCAVASCHDSQSQTGGLLLETGASYTNLVGHIPSNAAAAAAGWLRVNTSAASPSENLATSYLVHKIEGDLPDASYGLRMPRNRPKLNGTLRTIIRLWIEAGAPSTTWVPGTD
jgi:hypothetical protein